MRTAIAVSAAALFASAAPVSASPVNFSVPPVDAVADLHGDPARADLVIFAAGNQYMVMPALLRAFVRRFPAVHGVYYETLPPGILKRQMAAGAIRIGTLVVSAKPDVLLAGMRRMTHFERAGTVREAIPYASNVLAIAVRRGNPKRITGLRDLGRAGVRLAMPNPAWEGVAKQIEAAYRKAGGEQLVRRIMQQKVAAGTTLLTQIHHRQTPLFLDENRVDAGPVWISEALYQQRIGAPIETVKIPAKDNVRAVYAAGVTRTAAHAAAAREFLAFLRSKKAQQIYRSYGFGTP